MPKRLPHITKPTAPATLAALLVVTLLAAGCVSLPPEANQPKTPSTALDPATVTAISTTVAPLIKAHEGDSGFRIVSTGVAALTARIEMIDAAAKTLDLQYYIFRSDQSGTLIAAAVLRAAERGVRIRILLDDGETVAGDERILSLTAKPGIEVRIFNPMRYRGHVELIRAAQFLFDKGRLDYRMHNKLMVADNATAIIGGRNIGDQYFQIDPDSQFGDDDVIVAGPMVQRLSAVFDEFWNGPIAIPARAIDKRDTSDAALAAFTAAIDRDRPSVRDAIAKSPTPAAATPFADTLSGRTPLIWCQAKLAYDSPDKKDIDKGDASGRLIYKAIADQARAVDTELLMVTPYFIPSPDELAVLKTDRERHVRVKVLTNSLDAAPSLAAQSGYMHYRVGLLREGVELHEIRAMLGSGRGSGQSKDISRHGNYALHAKLYVFDRRVVFLGSMNYDQRSKHLNTEIGLLIANPELSREVALRFDALTQLDNAYAVTLRDGTSGAAGLTWTTREDGKQVESQVEPTRSVWRRMRVRMLSLLPLDKEL